MSLTPQWLDELRGRTTLSALIGRTIKVTKAGREYKACCPFHNEKSPSFTINDEKGFYHCFGCSAHGDAIRWMTDQRGLSFIDAVKELAAQAGMEVPTLDPRAAKQAESRAGLHDVMAAAQDWFVAQLAGISGAYARSYLEKRGLHTKTIGDFGFGFAPDSKGALREALKQFGDPMLIEAGLLIKVDDKEPYDRFRGRLMIPIRDARGRVIAFGGRILGDGEPKYLNSPDTPLFDKGRTLYNLDKCSPASRSTGRVIVVEGYMDVIALAQAGFPDVVAPLGTALTEQQIQMLWRMTEEPLLCFDGDTAGQNAAIRAAKRAMPIIRPAHSLKFALLPKGKDPDDIINQLGSEKFEKILNSSRSLVQFLWEFESNLLPLTTPEQQSGLRQRLINIAKTIENSDLQKDYLRTWKDNVYNFFADAARLRFLEDRKKSNRSTLPKTTQEAIEISQFGLGGAYIKALVVGLLRRPWLVEKLFEDLAIISARKDVEVRFLHQLLTEECWDRLERGRSAPTEEAFESVLVLSDEYSELLSLKRQKVLPFGFTKAVKTTELQVESPQNIYFSQQIENFVRALRDIPEIDKTIEQTMNTPFDMEADPSIRHNYMKSLLEQKQKYIHRLTEIQRPVDQ